MQAYRSRDDLHAFLLPCRCAASVITGHKTILNDDPGFVLRLCQCNYGLLGEGYERVYIVAATKYVPWLTCGSGRAPQARSCKLSRIGKRHI